MTSAAKPLPKVKTPDTDASLSLGVSSMDSDHATIEALFAQAPHIQDDGLPAYFDAVRTEIQEHFLREEALMRQHQVPVLFCHMAQHRRILDTLDAAEKMLRNMAWKELRAFLTHDLPGIVQAHVASIDRLSANFILGIADSALADQLRLKQENH